MLIFTYTHTYILTYLVIFIFFLAEIEICGASSADFEPSVLSGPTKGNSLTLLITLYLHKEFSILSTMIRSITLRTRQIGL